MMGDRSTSPADLVFDGLTNRELMVEHFPMLLSGIPDIGLTVHCTSSRSWPPRGSRRATPPWRSARSGGRDNGLGDVRADSVWFEKHWAKLARDSNSRGSSAVTRGSCGQVENLAIASTATPSLKLCVLIYWVRSGSAPRSMDAIIATYREGFRRRGSDVAPARTPLMIIKCVMRPALDFERLVFGEFLRDERNERLALGRA